MNPWTQMWLNYFPRAAKGNEAYFEKYRLEGTSCDPVGAYGTGAWNTGNAGTSATDTFFFGTGRKGDLRYSQDFRSRKRCESRRISSEGAGWTAVSDGS